MRTMGAHARVRDGRYQVAVVVVEDGRLEEEFSYPAPADRNEAGQLSELHEWALDVVARSTPDRFALRTAEFQALTAEATSARRAEGVVLAAAARAGVTRIEEWSRGRLAKPLTANGTKAAAVRAAVLPHLDRAPSSESHTEAACAAVVVAR